jgi:hypothetical protein
VDLNGRRTEAELVVRAVHDHQTRRMAKWPDQLMLAARRRTEYRVCAHLACRDWPRQAPPRMHELLPDLELMPMHSHPNVPRLPNARSRA